MMARTVSASLWLALASLVPEVALAQHGTRLDTDPAGPGHHASCRPIVVASGDRLHVVWRDLRDAPWTLYVRSSADFGSSWPAPEVALSGIGHALDAAAACFGPNVSVVWRASVRSGSAIEDRLYFTRSTDGGASWPPAGQEVLLNAAAPLSDVGTPQLAVSDAGVLHVAWTQSQGSVDHLFLRSSRDGGATWDPTTRVTRHRSGFASHARLATGRADQVFLAHLHAAESGEVAVRFDGSHDGGRRFPEALASTLDAPGTRPADLSLAAGTRDIVHVAWTEIETTGEASLSTTRISDRVNRFAGLRGRWQAPDSPVQAVLDDRRYEPRLSVTPDGDSMLVSTAAHQDDEGLWHLRTVARQLPAGRAVWSPERKLSIDQSAGIEARIPPERQLRIHSNDSTTVVAWQQEPGENLESTDVWIAFTHDRGRRWSRRRVSDPDPTAPAAASPNLILRPDRVGVVWDDRRHWTPHPGGGVDGYGAPETYFRSIRLR